MKGGNFNTGNEEQDVGNLGDEDISTNAEAVPLPWHCGEGIFPLRWLCQPYRQFTTDAPLEAPTKK